MLSGGSAVSASEIWLPTTVTVHCSPFVKSVLGSSVNDVAGLELSPKACTPEVAHETVNDEVVALTDSLKLTVMLVLLAICVARSVGVVDVTVGVLSIVNWNEKSGPGLSGGSFVSVSVTFAERIVIVQVSPGVKSVSGLIVIEVPGLPVITLVWLPETVQLIPAAVMVTLSVQLMMMFVFVALLVLVSTGGGETICGFGSVVKWKL